ncbi:uncharacterized protein PV09_01276 [Verruconis gallopava]|uniref:Non-structural maintenance of chromosomes element 1 homolog n=1 Tax=Verruconis gallopava TaxID=253628 RepID=A0A0D2AP80_9PEZI|nr:uncharacterized protein PV09_01276 [Verruconis gallopava]KIW08360.1 hypothetical protein PV09_01276 [Verruconis gallopava]
MATPDIDSQRPYNNGHRAFLQAFMSRGTMTFAEAKPILAHIFSIQEARRVLENDITIDDFSNMINTINSTIHPFDMEIGFSYPQKAQSRTYNDAVYALVNLTSDPQTQLATTHSPDEIAYVRRVLDGMFETNNTKNREVMAIRGIDAINLSKPRPGQDLSASTNGNAESQNASNKGLTKDQAEKTLASLVEEGWFEKSRSGFYSLSPRGLIELKGWLVETYNEEDEGEDEEEGPTWQRIKTCYACREIVTVGERCAERECLCRFHDFCARSFFNNQREKRCPTCKTEWTGNHYVGEKAAVGARPSNSTSRPTTSRQPGPSEQESETE